ncbi:hypothetical protein E2C01_040711 [Portunus trituberculatus]|uniref:Uncharacterized protein n=1 Tax=Portunus trituberculatus TaxID=210409 RepID=A0A5B7FPY1_PORTR|nr:hypothetical protein [Portunus trituberculatus]
MIKGKRARVTQRVKNMDGIKTMQDGREAGGLGRCHPPVASDDMAGAGLLKYHKALARAARQSTQICLLPYALIAGQHSKEIHTLKPPTHRASLKSVTAPKP